MILKQATINESKLETVTKLLCYISSLDIFIKTYTKYLSARLLNAHSALQLNVEEDMLQKIKVQCGFNQVNRIAQMFKDLKLSKALNDEYQEYMRSTRINQLCDKTFASSSSTESTVESFQVQVLTAGFWPIDDKPTLRIPCSMQLCITNFTKAYRVKYKDRNLKWLFQYGQVEVHTSYALKTY